MSILIRFPLFVFLSTFMLVFCSFKSNTTTIDKLSIDEKVGQLLMVAFEGQEANQDAAKLILETHVGGIIFYNWANGLKSPQQVQNLSNGLQRLARKSSSGIPLLISLDQEGGRVNRLNQGFTVFPSNGVLARNDRPELAERVAYAIGMELRAVGINMNLAPSVDVNINPNNPVIGLRAFGSTPEKVTEYGGYALRGYHRAGIIAVLKHFPGHGDVSIDSHEDLPIVNKSRNELDSVELLPFSKLVSKAPVVMTAHILIPALDPKNCATLSKIILQDLLRKSLNFQGVIISDSLVMQGFLKNGDNGPIEEKTVLAFLAGCDVLLFGGEKLESGDDAALSVDEILRIHKYFVDAVNSGRISMSRLDASVKRLLELKMSYDLFREFYPSDDEIREFINTKDNRKLALEVNQ